ncbi:hypothetical protein [Acinetobacter sp. NIPH 2699]|uniref:hypothetical protein n=1 Tax=Acinetobacter sp. NIPH 2699 TaxID=2923433 RepID=UPI001F4A89E3|nr:hypothetical protein [Acinetobacter sp. NIPH 2699]MCH7335673.1 hypothetical protein [Acinetobacter sp. NIPH 2699]
MRSFKYIFVLCFVVFLFSCDNAVQQVNSIKISEGEIQPIVFKEKSWGSVELGSNIKNNPYLIRIEESYVPDESCYYVSKTGEWSESEPDVKVVNNKVAAIESTIPFTTDYYGISVGDNEKVIYEKIDGNFFDKIENDDPDVSNQYFVVVWSSLKKEYGVKYNIVNNLIVEISIGTSEVVYSGCV